MADDQLFARLKRHASLNDDDLGLISSLPRSTITTRKGRHIINAGDTPVGVHLISSGWAARYGIRRDGTRRITGFMLSNDFCGIQALSGEPMVDALVAITDCTTICFDGAAVKAACAKSPAIAKALWRAKLVDEAILRMWLLRSSDAYLDFTHLICELHARVAANGAANGGRFNLGLRQGHLADALGVTAVHVSRLNTRLRATGMVDINNGWVTIRNVDDLRRSCYFSDAYLYLT